MNAKVDWDAMLSEPIIYGAAIASSSRRRRARVTDTAASSSVPGYTDAVRGSRLRGRRAAEDQDVCSGVRLEGLREAGVAEQHIASLAPTRDIVRMKQQWARLQTPPRDRQARISPDIIGAKMNRLFREESQPKPPR